MTTRTLSSACTKALGRGRARGRLGVPMVAAVVIALLVTGGGREPRFRELGLVVGG